MELKVCIDNLNAFLVFGSLRYWISKLSNSSACSSFLPSLFAPHSYYLWHCFPLLPPPHTPSNNVPNELLGSRLIASPAAKAT